MIRPTKTITVESTGIPEENQGINDWLRQGSNSVLPRNYTNNPALRKIFQLDDGDDEQNGGDQ